MTLRDMTTPASLFPASDDEALPRFLDEPQARRITEMAFGMAKGGGMTRVSLYSGWAGRARWARNRIYAADESTISDMYVVRMVNGAVGTAYTNCLDEQGLRAVMADAEFSLRYQGELVEGQDQEPPPPFIPHVKPPIWSERTLARNAARRSETSLAMIAPVETQELLSAGEIRIGAKGQAFSTTQNEFRYYPCTFSECSLTVRDPRNRASGWAGQDDHEWARIDTMALATRALDKCQRSKNPRAVEPGRYTAILEPQAVCDLFFSVWRDLSDRRFAEDGRYPFASERRGYSKINTAMFDPRLTLSADPMDPDAGFIPFSYEGEPYQAVEWIKDGVLKQLPYPYSYAVRNLRRNVPLPNMGAFRLQGKGPTASIEEMISTTKRGILITRFGTVDIIDQDSGLSSGFTRDGTWLIENGKITYAVKNFRFLESPIFVFNNVEQIGEPIRVFQPSAPVMIPALKVRDFNLVGLSDAV